MERIWPRTALFFAVPALQGTESQVVPLLFPELESQVWPGNDPTHLLVAYTLGAALIPVLTMALLPRASARGTALGALVVLGIADALFALTPAFAGALSLRAASGGASVVLSFSLLALAAPLGSKPVAALSAGLLMANVLGIAGGAYVAAWVGPTELFAFFAGAAGLLFGFCLRFLPPAPPPTTARVLGFRTLLTQRNYRSGLVASAVMAAAIFGPVALFPSYLESRAGLDLPERGRVFLLGGLGVLLGFPLASSLISRFGRVRVSIAGSVILAGPILLLPLSHNGLLMASLVLLFALFVETIRRTAFQAHLALIPDPKDRTRYLSLRAALVQLGLTASVILARWFEQKAGFAAPCIVAAGLAIWSAFLVPPARTAIDP